MGNERHARRECPGGVSGGGRVHPAILMTGAGDEHGLAEVRPSHPAGGVRPHPDAIARRGFPGGGGHAHGGGETVRGFAPELDSAREARHFVLSQLDSRADRALAGDAAIVIAELAANAIVHARSTFTVAVSHAGDAVRIAVRDMAPLKDGQRLVTATGHGLDVVAKIARRWAIESLPDGKVIWVELAHGECLLS